jgi:phosphoribosylformylglycinamidine (FGAM) synthase PurS component
MVFRCDSTRRSSRLVKCSVVPGDDPSDPSHRSRTLRAVAKIVVDVMLKPEIHDPQGEAIAGACHRLGFTEVVSVRQGKRFEVELAVPADAGAAPAGAIEPANTDSAARLADTQPTGAAGSAAVANRVAELAAELLANPIIEEFAIHGA